MYQSEFQFSVAGLDVALRSAQPDGLAGLAGFYDRYPSSGAEPGLILEIERVPGLARGRRRGPEYPGFACTRVAPGRIALSRYDAEGELVVPPVDGTPGLPVSEPVRGRFRVGESANTLEAVVRIGMSVTLPRQGGLIMHASAVAAGDRAYVFAGVSGAGKSTLATLLSDARPDWVKLADELVIVKPALKPGSALAPGGPIAAHVTPFIGGQGLPHGTSVPVAGVHFLIQAPQHRRERLAPTLALRELLRHVLVYVAEPGTASHVLAAAGRLVGQVPCYRLEFTKDPSVAGVLDP
jgi:hypothetical protein